jgi:hypothetical protein
MPVCNKSVRGAGPALLGCRVAALPCAFRVMAEQMEQYPRAECGCCVCVVLCVVQVSHAAREAWPQRTTTSPQHNRQGARHM